MYNIVLFEPRIPQNTGNIARTCAVTGCALHLIKPYAFEITERNLRRAGLTYWGILGLYEYENFEDFMNRKKSGTVHLMSSKGTRLYTETVFQDGDYLLFGREDTGVTEEIHTALAANECRIPMLDIPEARCLNIAPSVGIALYEALRQSGFNELR